MYERIPDKGLQLAGTRLYESSVSYWGLHNIALMEMFGWLRVKRDQPQPDKGWMIAALHQTAFGDALLHLLRQTFSIETLLLKKEAEEEQGVPGDLVFDAYQEMLQPYFPAWQRSLTLVAESKFREGVFVFKVALAKPWRRIAIPAQLTLDDLSYAILKAFDFDDDHLHCFEYKNRFGLTTRVNHPYTEEPPFTSEVRIGDVPLAPGTAIEYTFDFGDNWKFEVLLEEIKPPDRKLKVPAVLASHGQAPQQYPNWDEEEEND